MGKTLLAFVLGGCVGAIATYYITRDAERSRADEEIASMKAHFVKKEQKLLEKTEAAQKKAEAAVKAKNSYEESVINLGATLDRIKKTGGSSSEEVDEEDSEDSEEELPPIEGEDYYVHNNAKTRYPYQIFENQYSEEYCEFFDKFTLDWYLVDNVLVSEDGKLVDDADKIVGNLEPFKRKAKDGDELYFRNELLGADYMINVHDCAGIDKISGGNIYEN